MPKRGNAKNKIAKALIQLMKTEKVEDITITQLIKIAEVNRSTYYYHFYKIEDVIDYIIQKFCDEMAKVVCHDHSFAVGGKGTEYIENKTIVFYNYILENRDEYMRIANSAYRFKLYENIVKIMQNYYSKYTHICVQNGKRILLNTEQQAYWDAMASWAFVGVLETWRERHFEDTPENLVKMTYGIFLRTSEIYLIID